MEEVYNSFIVVIAGAINSVVHSTSSAKIVGTRNVFFYNDEVQNLKRYFLEAEGSFRCTDNNEDQIRATTLFGTQSIRRKTIKT